MSDGAVVTIRLTPRSSRDAIEGMDEDGVVHARVTAPPVDGAANKALLKLVAQTLDVPRSAVALVGGGNSRVKRVRVGLGSAEIESRWPWAAARAAHRR